MNNKKTLQIIIGVLLVAIFGAISVLIPYLINQRQQAQQAVVPTDAEQAAAWETQQSATATCVEDDVTLAVSFTNTESNQPANAMKVIATDLQTNKPVDLGIIQPGQTATGVIHTQTKHLNDGQVRFELSWADGHPGADTRFSSYNTLRCPTDHMKSCTGNINCNGIDFHMDHDHQGGDAIVYVNGAEFVKFQFSGAPQPKTYHWDWPGALPPTGSSLVLKVWDGKNQKFRTPFEGTMSACDQPSPTPTKTPTPTPTKTPTPTTTPTNRPSTTVTPTTPVHTPTPTPPACRLVIKPKQTPTGSITPTPTTPVHTLTPTTPQEQAKCDTTCTTDAQCNAKHPDYICYSATNTCRHKNFPQRSDCTQPPSAKCDQACTNDQQCRDGEGGNPDYVCYSSSNTCRHKNNLDSKECTVTTASPTPTTPGGATKPPTKTPTPLIAENPQLPTVGTSLPTLALTGVGLFILAAGALLLIL